MECGVASSEATSDMSALLNLLPPTARLLPRGGGGGAGAGAGAGQTEDYYRTVPASVIQTRRFHSTCSSVIAFPWTVWSCEGRARMDEATINGSLHPARAVRGRRRERRDGEL